MAAVKGRSGLQGKRSSAQKPSESSNYPSTKLLIGPSIEKQSKRSVSVKGCAEIPGVDVVGGTLLGKRRLLDALGWIDRKRYSMH